jgi:hypothetical protein
MKTILVHLELKEVDITSKIDLNKYEKIKELL